MTTRPKPRRRSARRSSVNTERLSTMPCTRMIGVPAASTSPTSSPRCTGARSAQPGAVQDVLRALLEQPEGPHREVRGPPRQPRPPSRAGPPARRAPGARSSPGRAPRRRRGRRARAAPGRGRRPGRLARGAAPVEGSPWLAGDGASSTRRRDPPGYAGARARHRVAGRPRRLRMSSTAVAPRTAVGCADPRRRRQAGPRRARPRRQGGRPCAARRGHRGRLHRACTRRPSRSWRPRSRRTPTSSASRCSPALT